MRMPRWVPSISEEAAQGSPFPREGGKWCSEPKARTDRPGNPALCSCWPGGVTTPAPLLPRPGPLKVPPDLRAGLRVRPQLGAPPATTDAQEAAEQQPGSQTPPSGKRGPCPACLLGKAGCPLLRGPGQSPNTGAAPPQALGAPTVHGAQAGTCQCPVSESGRLHHEEWGQEAVPTHHPGQPLPARSSPLPPGGQGPWSSPLSLETQDSHSHGRPP